MEALGVGGQIIGRGVRAGERLCLVPMELRASGLRPGPPTSRHASSDNARDAVEGLEAAPDRLPVCHKEDQNLVPDLWSSG